MNSVKLHINLLTITNIGKWQNVGQLMLFGSNGLDLIKSIHLNSQANYLQRKKGHTKNLRHKS